MGRGRAKAKQTKVARDLKYSSPNTDLAALQRELAEPGTGPRIVESTDHDDGFYYDDDRRASSSR